MFFCCCLGVKYSHGSCCCIFFFFGLILNQIYVAGRERVPIWRMFWLFRRFACYNFWIMGDKICAFGDWRHNKEHFDYDLDSGLMAATHCLTVGYFYRGVGKLHAWTDKNVLKMSSFNSSLSTREIETSDFSLFMRKICNACQVETGFWTDSEPLRFEKAASKGAFCPLSPFSHPIHPSQGCPLSSPATRRTRACLYAKGKERKDCAQKILSFGRLCSRSNFTSTSKTTNRDLFKASRPPGSIFWTNSHCLQRNSSRTFASAADELDTFYILDAAVDVFLTSDI